MEQCTHSNYYPISYHSILHKILITTNSTKDLTWLEIHLSMKIAEDKSVKCEFDYLVVGYE